MPEIVWEQIESFTASPRFGKCAFGHVQRTKVPGGWLVLFHDGVHNSATFVSDPLHEWDGNSLR
jgi:hypothetical protein